MRMKITDVRAAVVEANYGKNIAHVQTDGGTTGLAKKIRSAPGLPQGETRHG